MKLAASSPANLGLGLDCSINLRTRLWATVNLNGVSAERLRHFGDVYLGLLLWTRVGFAEFCREEWWGEINASGTERQETWNLLPPEVQKKAAPYISSAFS